MTRLRMPPSSIREKIEQVSARADLLEQQLIQSQRLATLGTLSMIVAHEFNNLLMTIINHADTALGSDREESMRRALEKTVACGEKASTMIRNMLGFAGATDNHPQRLNAARLMDDAVNLMAREPAKDGIEIDRHYDDSLTIEGPPVELTQVLLNLIINARQAMADSGGMLTLKAYRQEPYAALEVSDTGQGIQPEHLDKIFEPFFTTKKNTSTGEGGTGLGLYLARKIAREHGGDISVITRPGQGATFTVYLPQAR